MVMNLLLSDVLPSMFSREEKEEQGSVTVRLAAITSSTELAAPRR
jgi:hypothetical protein